MSSASTDPSATLAFYFQAGQAMAQGFMDFLAKQQAGLGQQLGSILPPGLPLPDPQLVTGLQREFLDRHTRLWAAMTRPSGNAPEADGGAQDSGAQDVPADPRFSSSEWTATRHFDYVRRAYLLNAEYLNRITELVPVSEGAVKARLRFLTRQYVEAMAPSNFLATNPDFIKTALETQGASITAGIKNMIDDLAKGRISQSDETAFEVGRNLAVTPGAVIFENELIQLIQYSPLTETVARRPFVIIPHCVNKYYILDLQPENSLVRYLVENGHTVFLASWRNIKEDQGHLTWDDYLELGPLAAFRVVREICGAKDMNVLGFCIGGTMVATALAVAAAKGDNPAASLTLLTSLLDYSDAGEIGCFVDETSVAAREEAIGKGGLLLGRELMQLFSSLKPNDLIWNYVVGNYLLGRTPPAFDILHWNSDCTNLPGPFVTYYLRHMYLNNELRVPGALTLCGVPCDLKRLTMPSYIYASREDHIVPWQAAYLSREVLGGPSTFTLGASGHIAGVINPASKNRRSYWINEAAAGAAYDWLAGAKEMQGSWWPHWINWLNAFRGGERPARGVPGNKRHRPTEPAPGRYVKERV